MILLQFIVSLIFLFPWLSPAQNIELSEDELAKESVLPVFEKPGMVRSRNIVTEKKFEMGVYYGWLMTEPIFDVSRLGFAGYHHATEDTAWGGIFYAHSTGLSDYAKQLGGTGFDLDFNRAPKPLYSVNLDYNKKLFYGKMSISKLKSINTHLQALLGVGLTQYQNNTNYFSLSAGVGYKFYFTNHLSLRTDLRLLIHQAPTPFKSGALQEAQPDPGYGAFKDRIHYTNTLDIGLNYLF
ncbi:MAG: outer membrane beta-barrel domain-containing protein [Bdellovibrionales bacterium]